MFMGSYSVKNVHTNSDTDKLGGGCSWIKWSRVGSDVALVGMQFSVP